jgi:biotin-(acetyl-CoA carboxylase) ligase
VVRGELLAVMLTEIEQIVLRLEQGEFPRILKEWRELDATRGQLLTWVAVSGKVVEGISLGPDVEGRLHIRDSNGEVHEILSGDVQLAGKKLF